MKSSILSACILVTISSVAHADLYEMVLSGQLTAVEDLRTSMSDALDGTVWDYDDYQPAVGDTWSYRVVFDTTIPADDYSDGDEPFAIYAARFQSSITLEGRTLQMVPSNLYFYNNNDDVQIAEIWGDYYQAPDSNFSVLTIFKRPDSLQELINGGEVFTSADQFDGLVWNGLHILDYNNMFAFSTNRDAPYTVTVDLVPAPSAIAVLGMGLGFVPRRRR